MRWFRAIALTIAVLLAGTHLAFGAALLWAKNTDHKIIVVSGGSMAPTFEVGDVILINTDPSELDVGDIVTYRSNQGLTTHRLMEFHDVSGTAYVQTKGDANEKPDPDFTPVSAIIGSVEKSFSDAGFVLNFMSSRVGLLVTLAPLLLYVLIYEIFEVVRVLKEDDPEESPGKHAKVVDG